MESKNESAVNSGNDAFPMREFFSNCLSRWKLFLVSILIVCGTGILYILRQQPVYSRSMEVLIKNNEEGMDIGNAFSSLGLFSSNSDVNNELISLTSPAVVAEVIERLGIDVDYIARGFPHGTTLYGTTLPFRVIFKDADPQRTYGFRIRTSDDGSFELYRFYSIGVDGKNKFDGTVKTRVGAKNVRTPLGTVDIESNPRYESGGKLPETIYVGKTGLQSCIEYYQKRLHGDFVDKDADVIELRIKDVSTQRAVDILNTMVEVYNENWVEDKNRLAVATSRFIDERLKIIEQELGVVDDDISRFKSKTMVPDLREAAKLTMAQSADISEKTLELSNKIAMSSYLRDYVRNPANEDKVLPMNTGIGSAALEKEIADYNEVLLTRNNLVANSSVKNPLVVDYDVKLAGMRESIVKAVEAHTAGLSVSMRNMQGARGENRAQLAGGPSQAKYLLSVERQQKVKESLYIYLLEKREENELTQTFNAYNTRIITPPMGSLKPVAPKKFMILGICFLLALLVPAVWIYIVMAADTKVRRRKDIEGLSAPFAGEIPFAGKRSRIAFIKKIFGASAKKRKHGELEKVEKVVSAGNRDMVSESFRIVRGNIDFMMRGSDGANAIMLTSLNAGSGKSFVAYNLAASFALKGKRVLVIDGDLRHGSLSQFVGMPSRGISNYLTGTSGDWRDLIVPVPEQENMYILPIGHRPPNPSELLDGGRVSTLLEEAKREYDYVFIDCPPVDVVVDTQIIGRYVDRTVFVVRAGLLDKSAVADIDAIYRNTRFPQMCVILNGSENTDSRYGSYGYYGRQD